MNDDLELKIDDLKFSYQEELEDEIRQIKTECKEQIEELREERDEAIKDKRKELSDQLSYDIKVLKGEDV